MILPDKEQYYDLSEQRQEQLKDLLPPIESIVRHISTGGLDLDSGNNLP
ncbi:MAG: hypothetical protein JWN70_6593 [Planctomycetaceae bacterium]|nr:hypothetical protein [Planctomycetaceae bacterium]